MILESNIIEFNGMPLFQKARFKTLTHMQGALQEFSCSLYKVEVNIRNIYSEGIIKNGEQGTVKLSLFLYLLME
jgi:hypothetical protein